MNTRVPCNWFGLVLLAKTQYADAVQTAASDSSGDCGRLASSSCALSLSLSNSTVSFQVVLWIVDTILVLASNDLTGTVWTNYYCNGFHPYTHASTTHRAVFICTAYQLTLRKDIGHHTGEWFVSFAHISSLSLTHKDTHNRVFLRLRYFTVHTLTLLLMINLSTAVSDPLSSLSLSSLLETVKLISTVIKQLHLITINWHCVCVSLYFNQCLVNSA